MKLAFNFLFGVFCTALAYSTGMTFTYSLIAFFSPKYALRLCDRLTRFLIWISSLMQRSKQKTASDLDEVEIVVS